ncbi:hypothetical protein P20429_0506 [Pseudoalteromonas sp. BSi20429]|nr:hypothetical protein P20429_0506 [Pseudoalteromonas sp. BSi20429]
MKIKLNIINYLNLKKQTNRFQQACFVYFSNNQKVVVLYVLRL